MKKLWNKISFLGIDKDQNMLISREIILTNRINFLLLLTFLLDLIFEVSMIFIIHDHLDFGTFRFSLICLISFFNLLLASFKFHKISRISLIVTTPFMLFLFPLLNHVFYNEIFVWYSYAATAISIIPFLVFQFKEERIFWILSAVYNFFYVFFIDEVAIKLGAHNLGIIKYSSSPYVKFAQLCIYAFVNLSVFYLVSLNRKSQSNLNKANEELKIKNERLVQYQKELFKQNEELRSTNEQLKTMQNQLINSEKMASLGVLTAGIAHEINNPLNFISSGILSLKAIIEKYSQIVTEILAKNNAGETDREVKSDDEDSLNKLNENVQIFTKHIESGIKRTVDIVNGLRNLSVMDESQFIKCDINSIIDSMITLTSANAKERINITKNFSDLPSIFCFRSSITQVFMNLLNNAVQSIKDKGNITFTTKLKDGFIEINIADTGSGIPQHIKSKIFEPFFTTKEVGMGTGLGLSISYNIIQKHLGTIDFESEEGKGTTFTIKIPIDLEKKLKNKSGC